MANKKETWPKRKMGKHCGYSEYEDGSIEIAPRHSDEFERISAEQQALDEFLAAITRVSQPMAKAIADARRKWWKDVVDDYGLEMDGLQYNPKTRQIRRTAQGKRDE